MLTFRGGWGMQRHQFVAKVLSSWGCWVSQGRNCKITEPLWNPRFPCEHMKCPTTYTTVHCKVLAGGMWNYGETEACTPVLQRCESAAFLGTYREHEALASGQAWPRPGSVFLRENIVCSSSLNSLLFYKVRAIVSNVQGCSQGSTALCIERVYHCSCAE